MIKRLVIGGGGPMGFRFLGALEHLRRTEIWSMENIDSIYATSIGCVVAIVCMLQFNEKWSHVENYFISRPWGKVFNIGLDSIFNILRTKGIFNTSVVIQSILAPLLEAQGISSNVSLSEFQGRFPKQKIYFVSCNVNTLELVRVSAETHPDISLATAVAMSAAFPGLFEPVLYQGTYYVDGGIRANYPIQLCLEDHPDDPLCDSVLGLYSDPQTKDDDVKNNDDSKDSMNMITYSILLFSRMNQLLSELTFPSNIQAKYTIKCTYTDKETGSHTVMSPTLIAQLANSAELRKEWLCDLAKQDAHNIVIRQQPKTSDELNSNGINIYI
jgi:predicted acylesterase/phospholipase RssA